MYSKICKALLIVALLFIVRCGYTITPSQENKSVEILPAEPGTETPAEETESFNPGDFMFDHIKDAHEWHILTVGHKSVSIPLPVI
jgi:hypothetical protein